MKRLLWLLLLVPQLSAPLALFAQPSTFATQIVYSDPSGNASCFSAPQLNVKNGKLWNVASCSGGVGTWTLVGSGGGGATFAPSALQFATSTTAARAATASDIAGLYTGCAGGTSYLQYNGTCASGGSGLGDPGSNSLVYRSSLNVTNPATYLNIGTTLADSNNNFYITTTAPLAGLPLPTGFGSNYAWGVNALNALGNTGHGTATNGAIAIGFDALENALTVNGAVAIGDGAASSYVGNGTGGEDGNFVCIGPFSCASDGTTTSNGNFEVVAIGNKAYSTGTGENSSVFIGTHTYGFSGGSFNVDIGGNNLENLSIAGVVVTGTGNSFVGGNVMQTTYTGVVPGTYTPSYLTILGSGSGGCLYNTSFTTVVGARTAASNNCTTLPTGVNNIFMGDGGAGQMGSVLTSGSRNIVIGPAASGTGLLQAGQSLTSGTSDILIGSGAGGNLASANSSTLVGTAAGGLTTVQLTAYGTQAFLNNSTGTNNFGAGFQACLNNTTGASNTCVGTLAYSTNVSGSQNVAVGYDTGLGETASNNSYVGYFAGRRNTSASLGTNEAFGYQEFDGTGNGSEQNDAFFGDSGNCTGCTDSNAFGHAANVGGVAGATQIGDGTNSAADTFQFRTVNLFDNAANATFKTVGVTSIPTIASAATIAPTTGVFKVSGTTTINTITPPTVLQGGAAFLGCLTVIPTGLWTMGTSGNILLGATAVVSQAFDVCYDGTNWNPKVASASGSGTVTSVSVTSANGVSGTVATSTTTPAITLALGAITPSSVTTSGTTPGSFEAVAGTGSIPALTANGAGFAAPATGGTAFLYKLPATAVAGILHVAAPATGDGVNESALTSSAVSLTADVSGILPAANGGTAVANTASLTLGTSNQNWATLGTGIVKNTTTTGAITDAAAADVYGLWSGTCSSSTFLRGDGACAAAGGAPSGTNAQTTFYNGTTLTATSDTLDSGTGIIQQPIVYQENVGPSSFTTITGSCGSAATTCAVASSTGYPVPSVQTPMYIAAWQNGSTAVDVWQVTAISGLTWTIAAHAEFNSTATAYTSGATMILLDRIDADSTSVNPDYVHVWKGYSCFKCNWDSAFIDGGVGYFEVNGGGSATHAIFSGTLVSQGTLTYPSVTTNAVCSSTASPAVCGAAPAGKVQIAAASTSLVIDTSAVTTSSTCNLTYSTVGITAPANMATLLQPYISAISAGVSFTITVGTAPTTNPVNVLYNCVN